MKMKMKKNHYEHLSRKNYLEALLCSILRELGLGVVIFNRRLRVDKQRVLFAYPLNTSCVLHVIRFFASPATQLYFNV